ncbi:ROK family protein [Tangfeifania diversioriginum]|uniref:ROK family protein n=1 Tax=Tangfeifania diversioriginum TaxID=1168035 RepID=UPI0015875C16|nr:ROK family protein [Tangfeifania diversioriginum]
MNLFFKDIVDISNEGRQHAQKRKIVSILNKAEQALTIPELCKKVRLSVPTGTRLINELIEQKVIVDSGKKETGNGRRPSLYKMDKNYAYSIGVIILLKGLSISVYNLAMEEVYSDEIEDFILKNNLECLETVSSHIKKSIQQSGIKKNKILGMGVGITGRISSKTGTSYNYFNFLESSLVEYFEKSFQFPAYLDNDTHLIGLAEQVFGKARNVRNAFVVNLSQGLGLAMITNREIVTGDDGFAGEFGHMQIVGSNKLCLCGKRGCLETVVSGHALEEDFKEHIEAGETSLLTLNKKNKEVSFKKILKAAREGDALSISLTHNIGFKLGNALGNIINLLNPGVIIIGGKFAPAKNILFDSIKSGMIHTSLSLLLQSCELTFSSVGTDAAIKGAGALVLRRKNLI